MDSNEAACVAAPHEVEWKCEFLERVKIVDAVMSVDSNYVVIGVRTLYYNVNFYQ